MDDPDEAGAAGSERIKTSAAATAEGLPIAPSMGPALEAARVPTDASLLDKRVLFICALAITVAIAAGFVAQVLTRLIGLITNLAFHQRISTDFSAPAGHRLGALVIVVPVLGALVVGVMARYGSKAIRGHGIPEAMEQVLTNQSRIPARITFLKPLSAAISIGTGGPFGAEGPIIATGGALGSLVGQVLETTAAERKTLLAAGAAAGMAATFGSPVSAVLLAIELLLFEYRARSMVPVALAAATATAVRMSFQGSEPVFAMPGLTNPSGTALGAYVVLGALVGFASMGVTRLVYIIEDGFERLPIHWMWWPALGGLAVGVVGFFDVRTMGVGYDNIENILGGDMAMRTIVILCTLKFISWSISLGSGTSGGTLAPLFTIGGGLGALIGLALARLVPSAGIDVRIAALVGMAAMFAGASRALLASVVFAFETTRQPIGLLPLLGGCSAAFLVSCLGMKNSIMTEKIARRGIRVASEYVADHLAQVLVRDHCSRGVVSLLGDDPVGAARAWLDSGAEGSAHQGFPVVDATGQLVGVVTRRDLVASTHPEDTPLRAIVRRAPVIAFDDSTLREAADHMVSESVGRVAVVKRGEPKRVVGMLTRSDLLGAHASRLVESHRREITVDLRRRGATTRTVRA
jgi:CIC family chloride channel protein